MPELPALSISLAPRALVSPSFVLLAHRSSLNFGALWCSDSSNKSGLLVPTLFRGMEQHGGCSYAHGYLLEFDPNRLAMYVYIYIYIYVLRERERAGSEFLLQRERMLRFLLGPWSKTAPNSRRSCEVLRNLFRSCLVPLTFSDVLYEHFAQSPECRGDMVC